MPSPAAKPIHSFETSSRSNETRSRRRPGSQPHQYQPRLGDAAAIAIFIAWTETQIDANADQRLWLAVIERAVLDALGRVTEKDSSRRVLMRQAEQWLNGPGVAEICDLCGIEPSWFLARLQAARAGDLRFMDTRVRAQPAP